MVILDSTIVYVALPLIQDDLGFSTGGVHGVMSAYLILLRRPAPARAQPAISWAAPVFAVGVALFATSSLICGFAWSGRRAYRRARCPGGVRSDHGSDRAVAADGVSSEALDRTRRWGSGGSRRDRCHRRASDWWARTRASAGSGSLHQCPGRNRRAPAHTSLASRERRRGLRALLDLAGALTVTTAVLLLVGGISEARMLAGRTPAPLPSSASRLRCSHCSGE